jgi:hypothetical protein
MAYQLVLQRSRYSERSKRNMSRHSLQHDRARLHRHYLPFIGWMNVNIIDLGMSWQQAIDAPRYRCMSGRDVLLEDEITVTVISQLMAMATGERCLRVLISPISGGQIIMIDPCEQDADGRIRSAQNGMAIGY